MNNSNDPNLSCSNRYVPWGMNVSAALRNVIENSSCRARTFRCETSIKRSSSFFPEGASSLKAELLFSTNASCVGNPTLIDPLPSGSCIQELLMFCVHPDVGFPLHHDIQALVSDPAKSQPLVKTPGPVHVLHMNPNYLAGALCLVEQSLDQHSADACIAMFRQEGNIDKPEFILQYQDNESSCRYPIMEDNPVIHLRKRLPIILGLRIELHPEELLLLGRAPGRNRQLLCARTSVHFKEKLPVIFAHGAQGYRHDSFLYTFK